MSEEHRTKISNSKILNRLIKCAEGEFDISSVQAHIGLGLLRKVMPDLAATDINATQNVNVTSVRWLTEAEEQQSSHTAPDGNSKHSTNGHSDGLSS